MGEGSYKKLSSLFNITDRMVRYKPEKINHYLKKQNLPFIDQVETELSLRLSSDAHLFQGLISHIYPCIQRLAGQRCPR